MTIVPLEPSEHCQSSSVKRLGSNLAANSNPAVNLPAGFNDIDGQPVGLLNQQQNPVAANAR
jgi:hypothetical protein